MTVAGANGTDRPSRAVKRQRHRVMRYLVLGVLEDPRFRDDLVVGLITVVGLVGLTRQSAARTRARLIAWYDAVPSPAGPAK